ncbi:MAG: class I SAM-dependent methyltransferase [Armatimonadaceae bacterium]
MTDEMRLQEFLGRYVQEVSAAMSAPLILIGERLGLYRALVGKEPMTPKQLAEATGTEERYVREWLCAQAAGGFVTYHPEFEPEERFSLPNWLIPALVDTESPFCVLGSPKSMTAAFHDVPVIEEAFRTGRGVGWGEHHTCLFQGTEQFYRAAYLGNLIQNWIPALEGVAEKLTAGAKVADVGCGHAASTILMAQAFPQSRFWGIDFHADSIETARARAEKAGVAERMHFAVDRAQDYTEGDFDLVCLFDCLHDMGDPVGAVENVRRSLKPEGTLMIVEPFASDRIADNLNPIGRIFYAASTLFCTPSARSQEGGMALGAQAGESRLRDVVTAGGFTQFRRAASTPFNLILEARP